MTIQFNTYKNIHGTETSIVRYAAQIESALIKFSDDTTRVEVHLSDEDGLVRNWGRDTHRLCTKACHHSKITCVKCPS